MHATCMLESSCLWMKISCNMHATCSRFWAGNVLCPWWLNKTRHYTRLAINTFKALLDQLLSYISIVMFVDTCVPLQRVYSSIHISTWILYVLLAYYHEYIPLMATYSIFHVQWLFHPIWTIINLLLFS